MSNILLNEFDEIILSSNPDVMQENANIDGMSPMGMMMLFASTSAKKYALEKLVSQKAKKAYDEGYAHYHDLDFYPAGTTTCVQIPLAKILKNGFDTGHGHMREPNSIMSAMALTSIIFQANQNQQHGGQSIPTFDFDLAPYVIKTYEKNRKFLKELNFTPCEETIDKKAWEIYEV